MIWGWRVDYIRTAVTVGGFGEVYVITYGMYLWETYAPKKERFITISVMFYQ